MVFQRVPCKELGLKCDLGGVVFGRVGPGRAANRGVQVPLVHSTSVRPQPPSVGAFLSSAVVQDTALRHKDWLAANSHRLCPHVQKIQIHAHQHPLCSQSSWVIPPHPTTTTTYFCFFFLMHGGFPPGSITQKRPDHGPWSVHGEPKF